MYTFFRSAKLKESLYLKYKFMVATKGRFQIIGTDYRFCIFSENIILNIRYILVHHGNNLLPVKNIETNAKQNPENEYENYYRNFNLVMLKLISVWPVMSYKDS